MSVANPESILRSRHCRLHEFPFQFCVGSHISMLIRESEVGFSTRNNFTMGWNVRRRCCRCAVTSTATCAATSRCGSRCCRQDSRRRPCSRPCLRRGPPPPRAPAAAPPPPAPPPPREAVVLREQLMALVIVAFVRVIVARLSHGAGAAAALKQRAMLPIMVDLLKRDSEGGSYHIGGLSGHGCSNLLSGAIYCRPKETEEGTHDSTMVESNVGYWSNRRVCGWRAIDAARTEGSRQRLPLMLC
jgi:hypothetical protein